MNFSCNIIMREHIKMQWSGLEQLKHKHLLMLHLQTMMNNMCKSTMITINNINRYSRIHQWRTTTKKHCRWRRNIKLRWWNSSMLNKSKNIDWRQLWRSNSIFKRNSNKCNSLSQLLQHLKELEMIRVTRCLWKITAKILTSTIGKLLQMMERWCLQLLCRLKVTNCHQDQSHKWSQFHMAFPLFKIQAWWEVNILRDKATVVLLEKSTKTQSMAKQE